MMRKPHAVLLLFLFSAIFVNLDEVMRELPDFDIDSFYVLAKQLNDLVNHPDFDKWSEIFSKSMMCKLQVLLKFRSAKSNN